jgi:hypothetical protein
MREDRKALTVRVWNLARLATSNSGGQDASNAAIQACQILMREPSLLREPDEAPSSDPEDAFFVPSHTPGKRSEVHPRTQRHLEWMRFLAVHHLRAVPAVSEGLCLSCGLGYERDEPVYVHDEVGTTHRKCGGWWRGYEFGPLSVARTRDTSF